jgi:nitroimidazol reductase NimA-like FMN-containing flavoprotein (pyridoxamine 5'-phosphate oxidase superfamily)
VPARMTREQFDAFLDSKPGWIVLSTIDPDGFPHSVPLGYFRHGDEVVCGVRDGTHKVRNVEANPQVSLLVEAGSSMADIRGAMIQGHARIVRDPAEALTYARAGAQARGAPESEWPTASRPGAAYIVVTPVRRISWDYGRTEDDDGEGDAS